MKNITNFDLEVLAKFKKIFCLVSGGIDSTYLYELIKARFPETIYPVNCWNPYESSPTLSLLQQEPRYIEVRPASKLDYAQILKESFLALPKAIQARKDGKYEKKIFKCCKFIKHDAFKNDPTFQEENTVVISGIKAGDGQMRGFFLKDLRKGCKLENGNYSCEIKPGFFHKHKEGQLYCYPFRDYFKREFPAKILKQLRVKYPKLNHSGCAICPVLVTFSDRIKDEKVRMARSIHYYQKLFKIKTLKSFF